MGSSLFILVESSVINIENKVLGKGIKTSVLKLNYFFNNVYRFLLISVLYCYCKKYQYNHTIYS